MGYLVVIIILCIGLVLALLLDNIPDSLMPPCWISSRNCSSVKLYFLAVLIALFLWLIPI